MQNLSIGVDLGLFDLLELLCNTAGADGIFVTVGGKGGEHAVLASAPSGIAGRRLSVTAGLNAAQDCGVQLTTELLLPSAITGWLGFRPSFVAASRIDWSDGEGTLFYWWKNPPDKAAVEKALKASHLVVGFAAQEAMATALLQNQERLDAMMQKVTLGIVFVDSARGSQLNPVAADLLGLPESTRDTATVVTAMQRIKSSCRVESSESLPFAFGAHPDTITSAEYWIRPDLDLALRVESHSVGDTETPGRFWIFTNVRPLWESTEKVKSANLTLERNVVQLAEEVERRLEAEMALRRYSLGLKQQNEELEIAKLESDLLANQDALTGLFNRRGFRHLLESTLEKARLLNHQVAVLFLDMDRFKQVNDTLGHERGDQLLRDVAANLGGELSKDDPIARMGGDEFCCAVCIPSDGGLEAVHRLASKLRDKLRMPVETSTGVIQVSATIGVALFPEDADDATSLLRAADNAMYAAKRQGGNNVAVFNRTLR